MPRRSSAFFFFSVKENLNSKTSPPHLNYKHVMLSKITDAIGWNAIPLCVCVCVSHTFLNVWYRVPLGLFVSVVEIFEKRQQCNLLLYKHFFPLLRFLLLVHINIFFNMCTTNSKVVQKIKHTRHSCFQFQEWQNSIQKNAGLAFIELINEGR